MDLSFRFDSWWERLPASPRDAGTIDRLVIRPRGGAPGERHVVESLTVDPEQGVIGDRWLDDPHRDIDAQVSLINTHVIRSLAASANGTPTELCGDNLHVDLDLTEDNLPVGTRLEIGTAILVVGSKPHRPCRFFVERFGARGAKKVARATRIGRRGRGVLCRVERAGEIRVGDVVHVTRLG